MADIACTWMSDLYGLRADREQVERLTSRMSTLTVFVTPEWFECAAEALRPDRTLSVLVLTRDDQLVGWVPFTLGSERLHGIPTRTLRLLGYPLTDRVVLPIHPDALPALVAALASAARRWDVAILSELAEGAQQDALTMCLSDERQIRSARRTCSLTPRLTLSFDSPSALRAAYGRTLRTRLDRARRKLAAAGKVTFDRHLATPDDAPALVDTVRDIESTSWKGDEAAGIFGTGTSLAFFERIATRLAGRGWLDIGILRLDGRPISYRFGFRFRGVYYDYNLAFDPAYGHLSPGRVLLDDMIMSSLEEGLVAVDASRSSAREPHLLADWTTETITHTELWIFGASIRGRALFWLRTWVRDAVRYIRDGRRTLVPGADDD